ncbi:flavin reductase family protein [Phenylobacterium sp. LjRoot225]|uniref:flavin reductase family protein n=1 Tax=Phenylobacterium sp. LjRoot225 TaxID=3342285 RepID=UPI003ECFC162
MADPLASLAETVPSPSEWRLAMGGFASGVTIVTSWREGGPVGATVSAFSSVSLSPPLLLICLGLKNPLCAPIAASKVFGVNILGDDGQELAKRFAFAPEAERFEGLPFRRTGRGAPQLDQASVFIDCVLHESIIAGDHLVVVGRGVRTEHPSPRPPLVHHRGAFANLAPKA